MNCRLLKASILLCAFVWLAPVHSAAQDRRASFRDFLTGYAGKEILLINKSADSLQFVSEDSLRRFIVVLDTVRNDIMILHRATQNDARTFAYPLADIRRITYLFGGRPYRRVVVETY